MNRLPFVLLLTTCLVVHVACGDIFVRGAINPGIQSTTGTISIVQLNAGTDGVSITVITLTENNTANTLNFCGDQRSLFPVRQQVQISFRPGTPCASVLTVSVVALQG